MTGPRTTGPDPVVRGHWQNLGRAARGPVRPSATEGNRAGELTPSEDPPPAVHEDVLHGPHTRAVASR
ncbi:hypothetical protein [Amycolatopsis plumensis]|uniref:hypothetical protein n=1 Tax=Amycolatopsis plumensis TaxID=236508 RepID=UPI00360BF676